MDDDDDLENLIDILINNQPLTSSRIGEFSEAIRINQQITNNIYNIRRYLERGDLENYNNTIFNTMFNNIFNFNNEITQNNELLNDNELIEENELLNDNERTYTELIDDERIDDERIDDERIDDNRLNYNEIYNNSNIDYNNVVNTIYNGNYNINNNSEIDYINRLFNIDFSTDSTILNRIIQIFLESTNNITNININENVFEDVKVTLTKEQFKKLDSKTILEENTDNKECNICMDEYKINDKIVTLDCKHIFHRRCIKHWLLQEKVTCPVCRKDVREQLIK